MAVSLTKLTSCGFTFSHHTELLDPGLAVQQGCGCHVTDISMIISIILYEYNLDSDPAPQGAGSEHVDIERFHVTSQSRENHTGGHFGVQLNGDLVCCKLRMQNAVQT